MNKLYNVESDGSSANGRKSDSVDDFCGVVRVEDADGWTS
jgi:hypothetical protein